ncbi:MAG: hypothetical protein HDT21_05905 [Ruminococcus sp.]|nr:hypothetical protein [Ruminococcus sp.]
MIKGKAQEYNNGTKKDVFDENDSILKKDIVKAFENWFKRCKQISFEDYISKLSESIDEEIITSVKNDADKKCAGGYLYCRISDDKKALNFKIEIFYTNGEQWFKSEKVGKSEISNFDPKTSKDAFEEIWLCQKNGEEYKLKIDPPEFA